MAGLPLCTAPFTSLIIDTHKGVRPCCTWDDLYFGNLRQDRLTDILQGEGWRRLREAHLHHEWPRGCINCRQREEQTGWSLRQSYLGREASLQKADGCYFSPNWQAGLTYLELNSSNLCNLACLHCTGAFSSRWLHEERKLEREGVSFEGHGTGNQDGRRFQTHELHLPDARLLLENLARLDLSFLETVNLKGGEPMLNRDVRVLMRSLHEQGLLPGVEIHVSTNGTCIQEETLACLGHARSVKIWLSVDGAGPVQEYIRHGKASIALVEETIGRIARIGSAEFGLCTSVMPYNVFTLDRILAWWESLHARFPTRRFLGARFTLMVTVPRHLSLGVLQDSTRQGLIDFYRSRPLPSHPPDRPDAGWMAGLARTVRSAFGGNRRDPYGDVIQALRQPYLGHEVHNRFVAYTRRMDACRGKRVLEAIPELRREMVLL